MIYRPARGTARLWHLPTSFIFLVSISVFGQSLSPPGVVRLSEAPKGESASAGSVEVRPASSPDLIWTRYVDPLQGTSSADLTRRALGSNAELAAARLDIERSRARLRQAGLRPNPTVDVELSTGRFTGSPGERDTSVGFALPLELGGKRQRRVDLARAELEAAEAGVAERERKVVIEVRTAYTEAMAALRELQITDELSNIDLQTAKIVEARVTEGESAPLELSLLRVEADRMRAQRALAEGRLQAALLRLKSLAGAPADEVLRLRETLTSNALAESASSVQQAVEMALRTRPDLRLARINEKAALASLHLAQAEAVPDLTLSTKYSFDRSLTDLPAPLVPVPDRTRLLSFGVSVELPLFKRNQGATAEAGAAVTQAQRRREFAEQLARSEVQTAYARYEAAQAALATFERGVLDRSAMNIRTIREAYRLGAFRVTELLTEQRRLVDSQREYTEILSERYRALVDLHAAIGSPLQ